MRPGDSFAPRAPPRGRVRRRRFLPAALLRAPRGSAIGKGMSKWKTLLAVAILSLSLALVALGARPAEADPQVVHVYKSPTCGCCRLWVDYMRSRGYEVAVSDVSDVTEVKREIGVPSGVSSCHTALVGGYFVEGHVPAEDVARLLAERPDVAGLAVPGMPVGSPGMEGPNPQPYSVLAVRKNGRLEVFADHRP